MKQAVRAFIGAAWLCAALSPHAAAPGRIMILDGESAGPYHRSIPTCT